MTKTPCNIYIDSEIKRWFGEHNISISRFVESIWNQYIDSDIDTKGRIIVARIDELEQEKARLCDELTKATGKTYQQLSIAGQDIISIKDKEQSALNALYNAMSQEQKALLDGKKVWSGLTMGQVESWIETRKGDFNLMLPSRMIIEKIKNDGGARLAKAVDG